MRIGVQFCVHEISRIWASTARARRRSASSVVPCQRTAWAIAALLLLGQGAALAQGNHRSVTCDGKLQGPFTLCTDGNDCKSIISSNPPIVVPPPASNNGNDIIDFNVSNPSVTWQVTQINATVNGDTSSTAVPLDIDNVSQGNITGGPHSIGPLTASGTSSKIQIGIGNGAFGLLQYSLQCTPQPGTLKINKVSLGGTDTFPIVATPTVGSAVNYSITTAGAPNGSGSQSQNVAPDTYTISETPPAGWILDSIQCGSGPAGQTATAVVTSGATTTCTVTNRKKASVTIKKQTIGGTGSFTFASSTTPAGQGAIGPFTQDTTGSNPSTGQALTDLVPGSYTFTETPPAGTWFLTDLVCDTGTGITGVSRTGLTGSFTLAPGATGTCTFTNTLQQPGTGTIIINKTTVGGDDNFPFTATGTGLPASFSIQTASGFNSQTFTNLAPGPYSVAETVQNLPAGWKLTGLTCGAGGTPQGATASITIPPNGGSVTCTFT